VGRDRLDVHLPETKEKKVGDDDETSHGGGTERYDYLKIRNEQ